MRLWLCVLLTAVLTGCTPQDDPPPDPAPAQQTGGGGGGGEFSGPVLDGGRMINPGSKTVTPAPNEGDPNPAPVTVPQPVISEVDARIVDLQKVTAENPNIVVVENTPQGQDPISFAASAYATQTDRIHLLNFQNALKQQMALDGKPPSLEQFKQLAQQMQVHFKKMKPYRMYGYDAKTGALAILEDKDHKKKIYEEQGIPWDE